MKTFRNSIQIKTESDWEDVASDVLDDFLFDFPDRSGLTREPTEDDLYDFDGAVRFMYTQKGMNLYYRAVERLDKLGNKLFPGAKFHYVCSNMIML